MAYSDLKQLGKEHFIGQKNDSRKCKTLQEVRQSTQYFDGLGKPLQTVIKKGSLATGSSPVDLVSSVVYDDFGREIYKYLPFAANSTDGNSPISDGLFKLNPFQQDSTFNKGMFSNKTYYYGMTVFEAAPEASATCWRLRSLNTELIMNK